MRRTTAVLVALALAVASLVGAAAPATAQAGPDPVIVVAGTFSPAFANEALAARIRTTGAAVEVFELPSLGTGDIRTSARALASRVAAVRARTGAARVDLVGHSQGGLVARAFVTYEDGAAVVDSLVTLGAPNQGTYVANLARFLGPGNCLAVLACEQMTIGSSFLQGLNSGDVTVGSVRYTNLYTFQDELVRPVANAAMGGGATNVLIQSQCFFRVVGHVGLIYDGTAYSGVEDALAGRPITLRCFAL
ncbi:MAG: lipase [Acidimicrobiia bacterium]|nr:lipase [Acidimicrobiia bacterium]